MAIPVIAKQAFGLALIAVGLVGLSVACGCMWIAEMMGDGTEGEGRR
jgi:hypothetical protein